MVLVYGATGFTGRLVAAELRRLGLEVVLAGRDRGRLAALAAELGGVDIRVAPVHDAAALAAAMAGARVVVACAGPFRRVGEPVVRAAIEAGAHYLDTTGEQAFVRDVLERFDSPARRAGVAVVPACGFEIAIGDYLAARAAARLPDADGDDTIGELVVAYAVEHFRPSPGTASSALDALAAPGVVWTGDRWEPSAPGAERRTFAFPELGERMAVSFPSAEVIAVPRHLPVQRVQTFLALGGDRPADRLAARVGAAAGPLLPMLLRSPLAGALRARAAAAPPPTDADRRRARFAVVAEAERRFERGRATATGSDIYGLTATIVGRAASRLHKLGRDSGRAGVLAPAQAFDPEVELAALEAAGVEVSA
jgi:short subunit dehydrogenase-like uncharacterized protein